MTEKEILDFFKKERIRKNFSQKGFAQDLGLTQQSVSRLEKHDINPSLKFLVEKLGILGYELTIKRRG